ncbi:MAG: protein-glutamate methylesterase/protein-glutamine glutaminase [Myxococcota bacterium]
MSLAPLQVLVIDDSAVNRRAITQLLESVPDVKVVDRARDGEEGLKKATLLRPDVITLDLEMPKLDGFSFLRLLMAHTPTPVIVLSSYAHSSDVFKALELGALDFIAKPARPDKEQLERLRKELLEKVRAVRLWRRAGGAAVRTGVAGPDRAVQVIAVGASTGGPPAVQRLLESMAGQPVCLLVSQHMPPRFTRAFADRLDRIGSFSVSEAQDGDMVRSGHAYIAPGGRHLLLADKKGQLSVRVAAPEDDDKHAPSVDRLFASVASCLGREAMGVVLTGMGADGAKGAQDIARAGGAVWAESEETAVVFGMPKEAIATGAVKHVLPLGELGPSLVSSLAHRSPHGRGQG